LNNTPFGIRLVPVVVAVAGVAVGLALVAAWRRRQLPRELRFAVPWRAWLRRVRSELFDPADGTEAALNVFLAASCLLAVGSVGYAVTVPTQGESFTEFYLPGANGTGGTETASPATLAAGEPVDSTVAVTNREHRPVDYMIVVEVHDVRVSDGSVQVTGADRLHTFETRLESGDTWRRPHTVTPPPVERRGRLTYLLYRGDPPTEPSVENAYRHLYLWFDTTDRSR
jgi:uncharacterized membrane protein